MYRAQPQPRFVRVSFSNAHIHCRTALGPQQWNLHVTSNQNVEKQRERRASVLASLPDAAAARNSSYPAVCVTADVCWHTRTHIYTNREGETTTQTITRRRASGGRYKIDQSMWKKRTTRTQTELSETRCLIALSPAAHFTVNIGSKTN